MNKIENCTAVVLAGGESKRMGSDKANTLLHGKPMLNHVLEQVEPLFADLMVSVHELRPDLAFPQIVDETKERGPMVGIKKALEEVATDWVFVIACDMPFVSRVLIQALAVKRGNNDAVLPFVFDRVQPLFGFYHKTCLAPMEVKMKQGKRSMIRLLDELDTCLSNEEAVKLIDPQLRSLLSLDTAQAVNEMESLK